MEREQQYEDNYNFPYGEQRSDKADLLDKINPNEPVEILRHHLMGEVMIGGEWVTRAELQNEAISEVGAWEITNLVLSVANRTTSICTLNEQQIVRRAYGILRAVIMKIISNWETYDIKNTAQIGYVSEIVFSLSYLALKQPENGGIKRLIQGTRSEVHQVSEINQPQKKNFMNRVFGS